MMFRKLILPACVTLFSSSLASAQQAEKSYHCEFAIREGKTRSFKIDLNQQSYAQSFDNQPYGLFVMWEKNKGFLTLVIMSHDGSEATFEARGTPADAFVALGSQSSYASAFCELK